MKSTTQFLCVLGLLSASGLAHAEGGGKTASVTFNYSALNYSMVNESNKPDVGTETKPKTNKLSTADTGLSSVQLTLGDLNFYFAPFAEQNMLTASYMVVPDFVEVGLDLGLNSLSVDKPKNTENSTTIGIMAWIYPKLGTLASELGLLVDSTTKKTKDEGADPVKESDSSTIKAALAANIVVPLAKNFWYVAGLSYANSNETVSKGEGKGKNTIGQLDVNLATLRITVD